MTAIILNWTYALSDNTGYLLQKSLDGGASWSDLLTVGLQLTYTDEDVSVGNTYWYHVAATNDSGTGSFSATISIYLSEPGVFTVYLTANAVSEIKPFDGTTASFQTPDVFPDPSYYGDTSTFSQTFDNKFVGEHDLILDGTVISNTGIVYDVTSTDNTGSITGPPTGSIDTGSYIVLQTDTDLPGSPLNWGPTDVSNPITNGNFLWVVDYQFNPDISVDVKAVFTSSNGINWTLVGSASLYSRVYCYDSIGSRVVGVDDGFGGNAQYSDDNGVTWSTTTIPTTAVITDVIHDGTRFVAVGYTGTVMTSSNGINWYLAQDGMADNWTHIVHHGGRYTAIGSLWNGDFSPSTAIANIYTSTDLITWVTASANIIVGATDGFLGLTYSPSLGIYVAVGGAGLIATSSNGVDWMPQSSSIAPIYVDTLSTVAWNSVNSYFAASDRGGYIYNSPDGANWTLNAINPHIEYNGHYYSWMVEMAYFSEVNKFLIVGAGPPG